MLRDLGVVGVGAVAASLVSGRAVASAPSGTDQPTAPTSGDTALLEQALALELSLSELYRATSQAGPSSELKMVVDVVAENHEAYAQAIAGITGSSIIGAEPALFDANVETFTSSESGFLTAARDLENQAAATHTSLLPDYRSTDAISATASIIVMEARYATVWSDFLGDSDLAAVFANDASPVSTSTSGGA
ncbi:ferritin-like domain-containing protein [Ilumatobacter sp.]|uniref:ferritin-like domain-containing protein n=1 Tax=Ilumatobacter sp. TaxID=1967498 RepID=UPI003B51ED1A